MNLRRYCTPRRAARVAIPHGPIYTMADYIAAFIVINYLIP